MRFHNKFDGIVNQQIQLFIFASGSKKIENCHGTRFFAKGPERCPSTPLPLPSTPTKQKSANFSTFFNGDSTPPRLIWVDMTKSTQSTLTLSYLV